MEMKKALKAALGGLVDTETKLKRRAICLECDEYMVKFGALKTDKFNGRCGDCGCWLRPATAANDFDCPLGKW